MKRPWIVVLVVALALVVLSGLALRDPRVPLGVRGEWEWPRLAATIEAGVPVVAGLIVAAYAGFAALGHRALRGRPGWKAELPWLIALAPAAIVVQGAIQEGAPHGYGLTKWVTIDQHGASGYLEVARDEMADVRGFLAAYPEWIRGQDALHIGTHPPGLFLTARGALGLMESHPGLARSMLAWLPPSVTDGFRNILGPRTVAERAAIGLIGGATLLACALSAWPVYLLARASWSAPAAWAAATLWPVVPAALMFQPAADTAFPLLSATALALAAWSCRRGPGWAAAAGLVLAIGMQLSLVFLGVGLVVGLVLASWPGLGWRGRAARILATGVGFVMAVFAIWIAYSSNPYAIWWANQRNHSRFYAEYPRMYAGWVIANPIELLVAVGLPIASWLVAGLFWRKADRTGWATLTVLAFLTLGGRNLGEVARLWLPFVPPLVVAAGSGVERLATPPWGLAATIGLVAAQALVMEAMIQIVYPF